jgi:maleylpyruvate isomerase
VTGATRTAKNAVMTEENPATGHAGTVTSNSLLQLGKTITGCAAAHRRLEGTLSGLDGGTGRQASLLPGWTVGHVLTHIARNAQSHIRMLEASLEGRSVEQYAGGYEQRSGDIEAGSGRPMAALREDVIVTAAALEAAWSAMTPEAWAGYGLARGEIWPCAVLPFHRWREVELHHVDLGLGYDPLEWPDEYVAIELPLALQTLPERLGGPGQRQLLAWLVGRAEQPSPLELDAWQARREHYMVWPGSLADRAAPSSPS